MRRLLLPLLLALIATAAGALALVPAPAPAGTTATAAGAPMRPVLSPRRTPTLLVDQLAGGRLRAALDDVFAHAALARAKDQSCLLVADRGRLVYSRLPDQPLLPASNMKVLTAAAVLERLGPTERLRTQVLAPPGVDADDGVIEGRLWLVGGGDPLLATADYAASLERQPQLHTPLESLADKLVAAGVREIRGGVAGDEERFDDQRYLPTWKSSYITDAEVGPASALVVNDGFSAWRPRKIAAAAPATNAASVLTFLLQQRGVVVGAPASEGVAPDGAVLATVESPPVADIVGQMLRESDNLTAELLVKELGRRFGSAGTTAAGLVVVRSTLADMGLDVSGLVLNDGSGLDRGDRASCQLVLDVLRDDGQGGPLARGLPVAGKDGTLFDRFVNHPAAGRLRAKTGSLDNVAGLSGWVDANQGRTVAFSFLLNGLPRSTSLGRSVQEQVGAILVAYPDAPPAEDLDP